MTLAIVPKVVQVIVRDVPTDHFSPPFGLVKVKPPRIIKLLLDSSYTVASTVLVTFTFTVVEIASGIVQTKGVPVVASTEAATRFPTG